MADEISETSAAASSGGNWWSSGGPNSMSQWSCNMNIHSMNMLLPAAAVTQPCSTTALAEIQQWSSDMPNSSGGRAGDQDVDNLSNSSNLSHQDLVDSGSALLDSSVQMGHFGGVSNNHAAVWTQVLLGSGEAVQNTSVGNLHEVLYSRAPRQELLEPSDHLKKVHEPEGPSSGWEFRPSFASFQADGHMSLGKPAQIPAPLLYNPQLLDDRLQGGNAALADLGGWSVGPPDQASVGLMSRNICLNTFSNSELDLPMPQFDLGRIKQECPNMSNYTSALGVSPNALLQGFGPEPNYKNVQEGFSHILESAGKPFLKSMSTHATPGACCSHINAGDHHHNHHDYNPHGGRWPISANMSTSNQLPVALSQLLPSSPSKQPPGVLTFGTNKQHFDGKQMHNVPAQHRTTGDEARADSCPDTKRCSADQSAAGDAIFKRPRLETSSTIPPFKVRKEKLGDRITALQQLVSPFGKTDTASVLLEAIGYIKFLQEQVQVLSTPYMKSGGTSAQGAQDQKAWGSSEKKDPEEPKQDLRSRGLCLVPVSCTLHVANDNGADYWTPSLGTGSYR